MPVHSLFLSSYTVRCTFPTGIVQRNSKHWVCSHTQQNECVSPYYLYASFCYYPGISPDPLTIRKEFNHMGKNRTRNNEFKFFLSNDEKALLEAKWKASGLPSRSSYIRNLIVYSFVYEIDYSELKQYNRALSQINNNINQIARKANTFDVATADDIKQVKEMMDKIWHIQRSMLLKQPLTRQ